MMSRSCADVVLPNASRAVTEYSLCPSQGSGTVAVTVALVIGSDPTVPIVALIEVRPLHEAFAAGVMLMVIGGVASLTLLKATVTGD